MRIIVSARLKPSQVKYKIYPLSKVDAVEQIFILRKEPGPALEKVRYIILPAIVKSRIFNILLTPFILAYYTRKTKADLIVSYNLIPHGIFAFLASLMTGIPFNYSQIDTNTIDYIKRGNSFSKIIMHILKKALFINVPGRISKEFYITQGIPAERIHLLHSTVDTEIEYKPEEKEFRYDLIYVGVLEKRKQVDILIQALSIVRNDIPHIRLAIVGDGPQKNDLVKMTEELGLSANVSFLGHRKEVKEILKQSKIFVLASKLEGIPCAVMEAMSLKLYLIVHDVADISDIVINNQTGSLLPAGASVEQTASEILRALNNWPSLTPIRENARELIRDEHSYHSATKIWINILKDIEKK
ncbi:MAG: glycosyltransferase [Bacteroidales bacterium]|nr:glycosyltransferase [Bacteroidales bacterium]